MPRRSPPRCSRPSAPASRARRKFPVTIVQLGSRFKVGPVRHRTGVDGAFDPGIERADHPHAVRHRAAHRRLEDRSDADPGRRHRREKTARARRRGLPRAGRRFHQCGARRPLAVGSRCRQDHRRSDQDSARPRRGDDLCLQRGAPAHRGGRRPRRRARGGRGRPRHGAHRADRARDRLSRRRAGIPPGRRLWLSAAEQGRGAVHRQPGRAARGARAHRRGSASGSHAVARRHGDLFRPHHSRQREGGRPHHQRTDRPGHRGDHRPHAPGACVGPSAPRRARGTDRLGASRKILIPVHGEALHLSEHATLARRCGVKEVVQCRNGDLVRLRGRPRRHHRRGAGRPALQGRLDAGRGRRPHGRRPPAPEFCRQRLGRARDHRQGRSWRPIPNSTDRHSGARPRRRLDRRRRSTTPC